MPKSDESGVSVHHEPKLSRIGMGWSGLKWFTLPRMNCISQHTSPNGQQISQRKEMLIRIAGG